METDYIKTKYWLHKQFPYKINQYGGKRKWQTMSHNGVIFPPIYKPHGVPLIYKNEEIYLDPINEEIATLYAKYIETEYVKNKVFNKNFWNDWKKILGSSIIQSLEDCDFKPIYEHILAEKEKRKITKEEDKKKREEEEKKYKIALVDGIEQPVGNFRMEPPGIFLGRGCNKNIGKIKRRLYPEDITINIGREAQIPKPLDDHEWKKVIHDNTVEWLASWKDIITGKMKYVWLGAHSEMKSKSDIKKFDLAKKLKKKIKGIREENNKNLLSSDIKMRQIATALYFIDNFALRIGNEKSDDSAETFGVTSLKVEHIELMESNKIKLDFLGKDSVRYNRILTVDDQIYKNIKEFTESKKKDDDLFDKIIANDVNKYLQSFLKGLTAKVFRTYNASHLFQKELKKINKKYDTYESEDKINLLIDEYNKANAKVAILCNHQKQINKSSNKQVERINAMIKRQKALLRKAKKANKKNPEKINNIKEKIKKLKSKKQLKIELKNISLGTSKVNYIDPRITVAFMKRHKIPIDKFFSKVLQDKFKWAFDIGQDYSF